jgi:hypothetical protein
MKKTISILFLVFSFFLNSIQIGYSQGVTNTPAEKKVKPEKFSKIVFNELEFDFGEVEQGVDVTHLFKFKNEGNSTLKVTSVKTSCGCTAALITKDEILPSKEGEIKVTFNTSRKKGSQSKRITVRSNDPETPVVSLTLKGNIKVELDILPDTIIFGQIKKNEGLTREIKIIPSTQKDFKVLSVKPSNDMITTQLLDYKEADKTGKKITVNLSKNFKPGRVNEIVTITTNNQKQPEIKVAISGRIMGDISFTPSSLSFISSSIGVRNDRRVTLLNTGSIPLKVEEVKIDVPEFSHVIKTIEEGKQIEITITFTPKDGTEPRISTKVFIKTNIPDQAQLEIPIYASLRQDAPTKEFKQNK